MKQFHYDSDMVGGSLMVRESRIIANLLLLGATPAQWDQAIRVDNLLQKRSPASAKRNAQTIRKRLQRLAPAFWIALRDGDNELASQVSLCGVLERNPILVEFMETVLRDAYLSRAERLDPYLWTDFLEDCAHRDPSIGEWAASTQKKTGQVAYRILAEAGYLHNTRQRQLQPMIIRPEIRVMLEAHAKYRIKTCMAVSTWTRS
jgi:hypothetical protein